MGLFDWLGTSSQTSTQNQGIRVAPETALEQQATSGLSGNLGALQGLVDAGPGQADVTAGAAGMRDLASMLQGLSSPTGLLQAQQANVQGYTDLGNQLFGGVLRQQNDQAMRQAALSGRQGYSPILQNKLAQQRLDTVGSFAAQQALSAPMQQVQFAQQRSGILDELAQRASANRQMILGLGSTLREQDRAYRINTGERFSSNTQTQTASPLNVIGGIAGIAGSVAGSWGNLKNMFGGGASSPAGGGAGVSNVPTAAENRAYYQSGSDFGRQSAASAPAMQSFTPANNYVIRQQPGSQPIWPAAPNNPANWRF